MQGHSRHAAIARAVLVSRPAGYADRELVIECGMTRLLVQSEDSPPLIDRLFAHDIDCGRPIESFK